MIGRIDPKFDRRTKVLHVNEVHAQEGTSPADGVAAAKAIGELATWLGAVDVAYDGPVPAPWRRALGA